MHSRLLVPIALVLLALPAYATEHVLELQNPDLEGEFDDQDTPDDWLATEPHQHAMERRIARAGGSAWKFWYNSSIYQDLTAPELARRKFRFGGYFYTAMDDPLRRGNKSGTIVLEFYDDEEGGKLISRAFAKPAISADSQKSTWIRSWAIATAPRRTKMIRFVVSCQDGESGDGSFYVDDLFFQELSQ